MENKEKGWIKLHRSIFEHYLFEEKRVFSRFEAWLWMLQRANHKDKKIVLGGQLIEVKRGEFLTSELKMMAKFNWGKAKLRTFLILLKNDSMIEKISNKKQTTVKVLNYDKYQIEQTTDRPQTDHEQTTDRPQTDTNKNDKNYKNDKEDIIYPAANEKIKKSDIELIFNYFCEVTEQSLKLSDKKKTQIAARLKLFTVEEIKTAITNRKSDPWYSGQNEDEKLWFKDWDSLFRNDQKMERALNLKAAQKIVQKQLTEKERLEYINNQFNS